MFEMEQKKEHIIEIAEVRLGFERILDGKESQIRSLDSQRTQWGDPETLRKLRSCLMEMEAEGQSSRDELEQVRVERDAFRRERDEWISRCKADASKIRLELEKVRLQFDEETRKVSQ
jgi:hypothetical protein